MIPDLSVLFLCDVCLAVVNIKLPCILWLEKGETTSRLWNLK